MNSMNCVNIQHRTLNVQHRMIFPTNDSGPFTWTLEPLDPWTLLFPLPLLNAAKPRYIELRSNSIVAKSTYKL